MDRQKNQYKMTRKIGKIAGAGSFNIDFHSARFLYQIEGESLKHLMYRHLRSIFIREIAILAKSKKT